MSQERIFHIGNMDCAHCAMEVEQGVAKLDGVHFVQVDFASAKMRLLGEVDESTLRQRVEALGKTLSAPPSAAQIAEQAHAQLKARGGIWGFWDYVRGRHETQLALFGSALILLTLAAQLFLGLDETSAALPYSFAMLIALYPIAKSGVRSLWMAGSFNINLLMSIAALGALFINEHLEAATVIVLFALGEALEGYTAERARDSLRSLMALKPLKAWRMGSDEQLSEVAVEALQVGDRILVKPSEAIPMDGEVLAGMSAVNQAPITGESVPVYKEAGATVYAASINGEGALTVRVTHLAQDSTLARIIHLVEQAQTSKAPAQRLIDRFAQWYTPSVFVFALMLAFLPPLLWGAPFYDTASEHGWLYRALSLLVIACPCSLVISTPVTIISAITAAARRGVLIKGGVHLESLAQVRAFAFDKTGTLTQGKPEVRQYRAVECDTRNACDKCEDVLALAASVEQYSTHPLAKAVVSYAHAQGLDGRYQAQDVQQIAGSGIIGQVKGQTVTLGNHRLFDAEHPHPAQLCAEIEQAEQDGQTTLLVCDGERVRGFIGVADAPRASSAGVLADLHSLGIHSAMLTGDNDNVAHSIGARVGIQQVYAGLLPQDKARVLDELRQHYGYVGMVGDGVNDAPALALATVGVAMGGAGSAQALEAADVALMADDLSALPYAVRLARFARRLIQQNVLISFGLKALFVVLALEGSASLWLAVAADMGVSLLVTFNGMRPLRFGTP